MSANRDLLTRPAAASSLTAPRYSRERQARDIYMHRNGDPSSIIGHNYGFPGDHEGSGRKTPFRVAALCAGRLGSRISVVH